MTTRAAHAPIAITGLGLDTSLGDSPEACFDAVAAGRCGLGSMPALEQRPNQDKGGGQAVELQADFAPSLGREARFLRFAIEQALASAGVHPHPPDRVAVVMG